jgi:hypothetical protein
MITCKAMPIQADRKYNPPSSGFRVRQGVRIRLGPARPTLFPSNPLQGMTCEYFRPFELTWEGPLGKDEVSGRKKKR